MAFTLSDERWMRVALEQAQFAYQQGEVPVGAIVVDRHQQLLASGFNQPISALDASAHAEMVAIRNACLETENYRLPGCTLYVTLEPCTMCFGAMIHARIERIVFATTEPRAGVCGSQLALEQEGFYNHQLQVEGGLLAEQSAILLKRFFASRRKSHA